MIQPTMMHEYPHEQPHLRQSTSMHELERVAQPGEMGELIHEAQEMRPKLLKRLRKHLKRN